MMIAVSCERFTWIPKDDKLLGGLARTLMALGDHQEAVAFFRKALAVAPYRNALDLHDLADCYRHVGNEARAREAESLI